MAKINITGTVQEALVVMSRGNPGALTCMLQILQKKDWYGGVEPFMMILLLDTMELYGADIYMLWSDCCAKDLNQMELVMRNFQMGLLSLETIRENLDQGRGTPFENLKSLEELFGGK